MCQAVVKRCNEPKLDTHFVVIFLEDIHQFNQELPEVDSVVLDQFLPLPSRRPDLCWESLHHFNQRSRVRLHDDVLHRGVKFWARVGVVTAVLNEPSNCDESDSCRLSGSNVGVKWQGRAP